ncbi:hypothetical protein BDW66DRAFT_148837 [Aspergillus desertorum]
MATTVTPNTSFFALAVAVVVDADESIVFKFRSSASQAQAECLAALEDGRGWPRRNTAGLIQCAGLFTEELARNTNITRPRGNWDPDDIARSLDEPSGKGSLLEDGMLAAGDDYQVGSRSCFLVP